LILAATQYESDAAQLLLEKGANVNAKTSTGRTALMQAIDGPKQFDNDHHVVYSPRIAQLLIAAGADVNAHDDAGNTALTLAAKRGYDDMAAALRRAGAKQ
jgi:ankyrin repeat protein